VRRREFITLLGGAATWPLAARAQQPLIGYLSGRSFDVEERLRDAFRRGLEQSGYPAGHNVAIEYHFSEGREKRSTGRVAMPPASSSS
jgi:putative ABC transport system substrate-binding protein